MSKKWISLPRTEGEAPRQAHTNIPPGTYEREMGKEGFFGPAAHFYHQHPPTSWTSIDGSLRPQAFDTTKMNHDTRTPWLQKIIAKNMHCKIGMWATEEPMGRLARNADGDTLLFIHEGIGALFCDFGHLPYEAGDYILLPRSTMWRLSPADKTSILMIEATNDSFRLPEKGMLGPHAVFDPGVLDVPRLDDAFRNQQNEDPWHVEVKRTGEVSLISYPYNPLDAVGWKGDLMPVKINVRDIRPVMSHRYHLPPSVHTTFLTDRFVVCTFAPRPIESSPGALKVPFFHNNDDYDEFLFYHQGEFFSRDNIHPGMCTLHPCGVTHGPHPAALANAETRAGEITDEVAVMVDTRDPLEITREAQKVEDVEYVNSWKSER